MDLLTRGELRKLLDVHDRLCVSIYMPAHRTTPDSRQDPIRFKNLLQTTSRRLAERTVDVRTVRNLIRPAEEWLDDLPFWRHQADGLAAFLTEDSQQRFRLPRAFTEQLHIGDQFHLTPLLPLLQGNGTFFVLAVSQHSCRLFTGNRDTVAKLDDANLPDDLRSALGWWRERELNLHSMQRRPQSRGGDDTAVYHGHHEDTTNEDLAAYFRRINDAVCDVLRNEQSPLVFAGVEYLFPIYRSVNEYAGLCNDSVAGSPDDVPATVLHQQAWEIVRPLFASRERAACKQYPEYASQGKATDDYATLLRAACDGLVDTLIIAQGEQMWGHVDSSGNVDVHGQPGQGAEEDLLDRASRLTLKASGTVLAVDAEAMPSDSKAAAILRAPISTVSS